MKVVTCLSDSDNEGFRNYLQPSCEKHQLDLIVLKYDGDYQSHRVKDQLLKAYINSVDDDELILFTDAYDTIFLTGEAEIISKFQAQECELLFSSEINCWPSPLIAVMYAPGNHHFKYLNSGGFIGRAGYVKHLLKTYPSPPVKECLIKKFDEQLYEEIADEVAAMNEKYKWSNQYYWHWLYLNHPSEIKVDHNCEIFYTLSTYTEILNNVGENLLVRFERDRIKGELRTEQDRIVANITNTVPCHLHFNGSMGKKILTLDSFKPIFTVDAK